MLFISLHTTDEIHYRRLYAEMKIAVRMYITITILMTATVILAVMQVAACAATDDRKENDMKGKGKVLVVFSRGQARTMPWGISKRETPTLWLR